MVELSEAGRSVVEMLIAAPVAWQSPSELSAALGRGLEETTDLLCDLDLAGWLEVWEGDAGPAVTLSPLAAERLGVRLVEAGPATTPRWGPVGDPEPPPPRSSHVCPSNRGASLEFVADVAPQPLENAAQGERAAAFAAHVAAEGPRNRPREPRNSQRLDDPPLPSVLVGMGLTPWPGPGQGADPVTHCPACGSRRLGPQMYCLYCDRWGLDQVFATCPDRNAPPRPRGFLAPDPALDRIQSEQLRARRRAKRQKHLLAQIEAERQKRRKAQGHGSRPPGYRHPKPRPGR